jgi:hypothetical protein
MGMHGALVAVEDAQATTALIVGARIMDASVDADGVRTLSVGAAWKRLSRTLAIVMPGALAPFVDGAGLFVGDLDPVIVAELDAMDEIDEAFEIAGRHGASVMAVLEATSYGPAFWLPPDAVAACVAALAELDRGTLHAAATQVAGSELPLVSDGIEIADAIVALIELTASFMAAAAVRGDGIAFGVT